MNDSPEPELDAGRLRARTRALRSLARSISSRHDLAEDASQDAWLAFLRRRPGSLDSPSEWLATATRQAARNAERRERRTKRRERRAVDPDLQAGPDEELAGLEAMRALEEAVGRLSEPQREVIVLHYYEELTARETAERLGVPLATVRGRVHRALALLREDLSRNDDGRRAVTWLARRKRTPWSIRLGLPVAAALAGFLLFVELRYESSLFSWIAGTEPGEYPTSDEPSRPPNLASFAGVWGSSEPAADDGVRESLELLLHAFHRPIEKCGSQECGREELCPACRELAADDEHFARVRAILREDESAWAVLDALTRPLLSDPKTSAETIEGIWNLVVLSHAQAGAEVTSKLLDDHATTCRAAHLIALDRAGAARARDLLARRADGGDVRASAYLASGGDDRGARALRRVLREGVRPVEIAIAGTALRALEEARAAELFAACVDRMRSAVLEALEAGEVEESARRLAEAEHVLRSFGPTKELRTYTGTPWWGLDPTASYVAWKPGAADPVTWEVRIARRMRGDRPSADALRERAAGLGRR